MDALSYTTKCVEGIRTWNEELMEMSTKYEIDEKGQKRVKTQSVERTYYPRVLAGGNANAAIVPTKQFFNAFAKATCTLIWNTSK